MSEKINRKERKTTMKRLRVDCRLLNFSFLQSVFSFEAGIAPLIKEANRNFLLNIVDQTPPEPP